MATVKYFLQSKKMGAPIYCRLSLGRGNTPTRKTGLTCDPRQWSKVKGYPISKDENTKLLKGRLRGLESYLFNQLNTDQAKGKLIDGDWLQTSIDMHFGRTAPEELEYLTNYAKKYVANLQYRVSAKGGVGVSMATKKKYQTILNKLQDFEGHQGKRYLLSEVNLDFRSKLIRYLLEEDRLSQNTVGRYIKFVKSFVLDARKHGFEVNPQIEDYKGFTVKASKVTLSFDELKNLQAKTIEDEVLDAARDWLVIGCYTGQRVSDLLRMSDQMLTTFNGFEFLVVTQKKTGRTVQIPLHRVVKQVLDKRGGHFPPTFSRNPGSNAAIFNRHIKTVCRMGGITDLVEGTLFDEESKRSQSGTFPKYKLITSHVCRRSFATNFYADQKYPTPILMNITAHSTEKMFLEYIGKEPLDYSLQLARAWEEEQFNTSELRIVTNATKSV